MALQVIDEADVRRIAREEAQRPTYITQRNVEAVLGLPRRHYLRHAHAGAFASTKEGRLIIARTADVIAFVELRLRFCGATPANDSDAETIALERVGARRVAS